MAMNRRKLFMDTGSGSSGWVLVCVMIFLLVVQASAVGIAELVKYGTRSAKAFCDIEQGLYVEPSPASGLDSRHLTLGAPEGWSHRYFMTSIELRRSRCIDDNIEIKSAYWKVCLSCEPHREIQDAWLWGCSTYIIVLVDDSESMNWSSGAGYDPGITYLKRPTGEVVKTSCGFDVQDFVKVGPLLYFKGEYGNSHFPAPLSSYFMGAMPRWTLAFGYLMGIVEGLDMVKVAVATTSRGIIQPFTSDMRQVEAAIDSIHPHAVSSPLAHSLFSLKAEFKDKCVQNRYVLLVTDGDELKDGDVPDDIKDFDMDSDPMDKYVEGLGSRCLDDVASYLKSMDVRVFVKGACPDETFLREVARKGGGIYSPARQDLVPECVFISQTPVIYGAEELELTNCHGVFSPKWLSTDGAMSYELEGEKPIIAKKSDTGFSGVVVDTCVDGATLYCSTSRDYLLSMDLESKALKWVIHGLGGKIRALNDTIVVGPGKDGFVYVINSDLKVLWKANCALALLTPGCVYTVNGADIEKRDMNTGEIYSLFSAGMDFSSIDYDPFYGFVIAGTSSGDFYVFDAELGLHYIINTYSDSPAQDAGVFTWRKKPYFVLATDMGLSVNTTDSLLWYHPFDGCSYTGAVVMDSRIYLGTWKRSDTCQGIDAGKSFLDILDAFTGDKLEREVLFQGMAFGPVIDLASSQVYYVNWKGDRVSKDISGLGGIRYSTLGKCLKRG